jgi:hypothetical protein
MKYEYRAYLTPRNTRNLSRTRYFKDRDELVQFFASGNNGIARIYSTIAGNSLERGETLDGFQREVALTKKILELESEIQKLKKKRLID